MKRPPGVCFICRRHVWKLKPIFDHETLTVRKACDGCATLHEVAAGVLIPKPSRPENGSNNGGGL